MLHSLHLPTPSSHSHRPSHSHPYNPNNNSVYIKFRTSYRENLRYLKTLSIIPPNTHPNNLPLPDTVDRILQTLNLLKSHSFSDSDFPRLATLSPRLFSSSADISAVFLFLSRDLSATPDDSRGLVLRCPNLLLADADLCLRPTLRFLQRVGLTRLNRPTNRNAHLLNTRVEKLRVKVEFLEEVGFGYEEAVRACARVPAIFGYGLESNLWPKVEYLVREMEREVEELKGFPQYFGFSLEKRIVPRHLHLKERGVRIPLNRMLMWGDDKFYARWK